MKKKNTKEYLRDFLKIAPLSHALWRSVEALSFSQVNFRYPVLDIGCGFGEFAGVVFDRIEMGIDINEKDLARALKGKQYKKLKWADARNLPFKDSSYNTAVSVSVMEHIERGEKIVSEVYRVLKSSGIFAFSVPTPKIYNNLIGTRVLNFLGFKGAADKYFELHCRVFKHVNLHTADWWAKHLKKSGFEIILQEGTISPTLLKLHEIFLITAFPSQFGKLFFGKRFMMSVGLRSAILPHIFSRFVYLDKDSDINIFFVARKKT